MNSVNFGKNKSDNTKERLQMDYVWREASLTKWTRWKHIVIPQRTWDINVHYMYMGGTPVQLDYERQLRMNHYRKAHSHYLHNPVRDSSLQDAYRRDVSVAMDG